MEMSDRDIAIKKITESSTEQVLKVLIFMAGMEAGSGVAESSRQRKEQKEKEAEQLLAGIRNRNW